MNVLPLEEKKNIKKEYRLRLLGTIFFALFILALTATVLLLPSYISSQTKMNLLEEKLAALNALHPEISQNDLSKIASDINATLALLDKGKPIRNISEDLLAKVFLARPAKMSLNQILYSERTDKVGILELHGIAPDRASLYVFKTSLESIPTVASVDLPISNFVKPSDIPFVINVKTK